MFSHIMVGANDVDRAKTFYDAVLGALGASPGFPDGNGRVFYMHNGSALGVGKPIDGGDANSANGGTIGFTCTTPEQVDAFHAAGVAAGGTSIEDPPGERDGGSFGKMYLAYLRDPDGNKLCGFHRVVS